jgi:hypothetical protein
MAGRARLIAALSLFPACIAPSVVESSGRAVEAAPAEIAWRPATADDLQGLYESVQIEGEAAVSLWKIYYHFSSDGSYSGAALVLGGEQPQFQTLSGHWKLEGEELDLGEGQRVRALAGSDHLKLESESGTALLRRVAVQ